MTTRKTVALTRWTFVGKVMSLLFNMLSRLVIAFLPRNKHLLISWQQSPTAVILEPKKIKFPQPTESEHFKTQLLVIFFAFQWLFQDKIQSFRIKSKGLTLKDFFSIYFSSPKFLPPLSSHMSDMNLYKLPFAYLGSSYSSFKPS